MTRMLIIAICLSICGCGPIRFEPYPDDITTCEIDSRFIHVPLMPRKREGLLSVPNKPGVPDQRPQGIIDLAITQGDKWRRSNGNPPSGWDATPEGKAAAAMFGPNSPLRFDYWDMAVNTWSGNQYVSSDVAILVREDGSITYFPPIAQSNVGITDEVFCAAIICSTSQTTIGPAGY